MSQSLRISDLQEIGKSMSEQQTGREDRPATGQDLYNFALKVDTNFMILKNDMSTGFAINSQEFTIVRAEMRSEFKAVRAEMKSGFDNVAQEFINVRAEMHSEFKAIRAEMKSGFDNVAHQFDNVAHQFDNVAHEFVNFRAEMRNEMSGFKSSIIAWVAMFGIATISITTGLGIAIILKI